MASVHDSRPPREPDIEPAGSYSRVTVARAAEGGFFVIEDDALCEASLLAPAAWMSGQGFQCAVALRGTSLPF